MRNQESDLDADGTNFEFSFNSEADVPSVFSFDNFSHNVVVLAVFNLLYTGKLMYSIVHNKTM